MKSRSGPILLIVLGTPLALGPLWGIIGTVVGMIRAFGTLQEGGPAQSEQLAADVSFAMQATKMGFIISPLGYVLLIVGIVWIIRINKRREIANS
jgi:biopolymer transport protein ExbB/TolQ